MELSRFYHSSPELRVEFRCLQLREHAGTIRFGQVDLKAAGLMANALTT
jgi:hypothetical protein